MSARRGVLTAGTWCVDLNKSIRAWPREDSMNTIVSLDRQGGGSACNMAIDLKRLDPGFWVDTMGVVGDDDDGRFLRAQCDAFGIGHAGLVSVPGAATPFSDCFNSLESGRRTHFYGPGVASALSPEHFDFSATNARILHLGLPGAHAVMDGRWKGDSTGWAATLRAARAVGLETNLEMVSTDPVKVRAFGLSCAPHLDLMIVNDYEIGCVADVETRDDDGRAIPGRVEEALREVMALGPVKLAVVHFPEGAIAMTEGGSIFALGSLAMPSEQIAGVNGAGDAFAAGMLYAWHEGWDIERGLRLGHACAAASMREISTTLGVLAVAGCLALADKYGHRPTPN
jgi:sugar/nucleoside kinase (ribokinase family)